MSVLLNTAYFPPIQYFIALSTCRQCDFTYIEACENYQKQSYRNRCNIYSAGGLETLSVPVIHEGGTHSIPIDKIKVDYSAPWLLRHERAIVSAYGTSAFFEYYRDELFSILDSRPETLWELNINIIRFFLRKLGLPVNIRFTQTFSRSEMLCGRDTAPATPVELDGLPYNNALEACDLREIIHPKREDDIAERLQATKPYFQVFARKHGFIKGLSIMDLLFNEDPDAISYIRTSIPR